MKNYKKTHKTKQALNSHIAKIKARGGKYSIKGNTIEYSFNSKNSKKTHSNSEKLPSVSNIKNYKQFKKMLLILIDQTKNSVLFSDTLKTKYSILIPKYYSEMRKDIFNISDKEWINMQQAQQYSKMAEISWENCYKLLK